MSHSFWNTNKIKIIKDFQNHDNQNSCAYKQGAVDFFWKDFLSKFHKTNSYSNGFSTVRNQLWSYFVAKKKITFVLKFIYSEKDTKFCEIFPLLLTVCTVVKSKGKISQKFVAFSEYMNFNRNLENECSFTAK